MTKATEKLSSLLDTIEMAEHLYQQQAAALEFAEWGRDLLAVVEAAKACASYETGRTRLRQTLAALEEG